MEESEALEWAGFTVPKTVRIDAEMEKELKIISAFEKKKVGTLIRDWIYLKIRTYRRNPEYKRWKKLLFEASK